MTQISDADVIIVGSGPAGISAAWALLESGLKVLLVDNGQDDFGGEPKVPEPIWDVRVDDHDQIERFVGSSIAAPDFAAEASTPKMRVPAFKHVQAGFLEDFGLSTEGIQAVGARAVGGLSRMWGAGAPTYRDIDMAGWPIKADDLSDSYRRVAERIGIAGDADVEFFGAALDDEHLLPSVSLPPALETLWQNFHSKSTRQAGRGFAIARARNAVLTAGKAGRQACSECGGCLYGCSSQSIYNAADEILELSRHPLFHHATGISVQNLRRCADGDYEVLGRDRNADEAQESVVARSRYVLLAAGALGSTILAARLCQKFDKPISLQAHPAFALAMLMPSLVGTANPERFFALSSLCFSLFDEEGDEAQNGTEFGFGSLFPAAAVPASEFVSRMPLSRPSSAALTRLLQPAMVLANCYLPGNFAEISLQVTPNSALLKGSHTEDFHAEQVRVRKLMVSHFRRFGLHFVPTSATVAKLGSDGHFVAGLPMTSHSSKWGVSVDGELNEASGVFVADGSVLPSLASRHPTFTIMANADRIGRSLAKKIRSGSSG